jgi:hypothetical protein
MWLRQAVGCGVVWCGVVPACLAAGFRAGVRPWPSAGDSVADSSIAGVQQGAAQVSGSGLGRNFEKLSSCTTSPTSTLPSDLDLDLGLGLFAPSSPSLCTCLAAQPNPHEAPCRRRSSPLMVLARVADTLTNGASTNTLVDDGHGRTGTRTMHKVESAMAEAVGGAVAEDIDEDAARPPYLHVRAPNTADGRHVN